MYLTLKFHWQQYHPLEVIHEVIIEDYYTTWLSTSIAMSMNISWSSLMLFSSLIMSACRASMSARVCLAAAVSIIMPWKNRFIILDDWSVNQINNYKQFSLIKIIFQRINIIKFTNIKVLQIIKLGKRIFTNIEKQCSIWTYLHF